MRGWEFANFKNLGPRNPWWSREYNNDSRNQELQGVRKKIILQYALQPRRVRNCPVKYDYIPWWDRKSFFFRSDWRWLWYLTLMDRNRADGDFRQPSPWWSGKQLWIDLGERSDSFWGEEDRLPTWSGQNLMETQWKVISLTNCRSNCTIFDRSRSTITHRTRVQTSGSIQKKLAWKMGFCAENMCNLRACIHVVAF